MDASTASLPHPVRLSAPLLARIDALRALSPLRVSRHAVLVQALELGVAELEQRIAHAAGARVVEEGGQ